jgi:hypothetical protein
MIHHDLHDFMRQASEKMAADYKRIVKRSREDPGTAGDEGEANWKHLLSRWLPANYHIKTKGRIVSTSGKAGPQVDVVVLDPSYPLCLLDEKVYLAGGVLAAFECKLTLRPEHIEKAFQNCHLIKTLLDRESEHATPYQELHAPIIYGLLAHSQTRNKRRSPSATDVENMIIQADRNCSDHPKFMMDCVCIANLACWGAVKYARYPPLMKNGMFVPLTVYRRSASGCQYLTRDSREEDPICTPIGGLVSDLLVRLAWERTGLRPVARYFSRAAVAGPIGHGIVREWPLSIFSESVQERIASADISSGWGARSWDEWQWEFP